MLSSSSAATLYCKHSNRSAIRGALGLLPSCSYLGVCLVTGETLHPLTAYVFSKVLTLRAELLSGCSCCSCQGACLVTGEPVGWTGELVGWTGEPIGWFPSAAK